ncbi:hypothetical protein Pmani_037946 [Petrolisthes manimaculis]|uniref:Equilibrative nucleoside transporter 3 n=1 Tax=Petrolisthes manimaculis TaxID=1843537 RepID=A0AAE1NH74_9EUCA|nr:hypothetical protein Pmani_037946 [Petrolisthes manimaculis]
METPPKAPFGVILVFYMLGIAALLPWNFFITAETYWQYKLRNVSMGSEWDSDNATLTNLQLSFTPTLVLISNVVATLFFIVTSAIVRRVPELIRMLGSLTLSLLAMLSVTLLTVINSDSWQTTFFVITMVIVALLNVCVAVIQGSTTGLAGMFHAVCMTSLLSGQTLAGIFSSLARIVSLAVGEEPIQSGLIFFTIADVFLVITLAGYVYLTNTEHYKNVKQELTKNSTVNTTTPRSDFTVYITVLKKIWPLGFTLGLTLLIVLSVFPGVVVYVTSTMPESTWTQIYFQPTITFLLFNVMDFMGREMLRFVQWPSHKGWLLHVLGASRVIFIPLLLLCNGDNKSFPTLFNNDAYYIVILILFGITNGYFIGLPFIYYPRFVEKDELEVGGAIMVALLGVGMVLGSLISPALIAVWGPQ